MKKRLQKTIILELSISAISDNELVIKAWNTGSVGENTVKIDFYSDRDLKRRIFSKSYSSLPGLASGLKISYEK